MEIIIITNNSKVNNIYKETNEVIFKTKEDLIELLEDVKKYIGQGHKILSDPIMYNLESPENPYKSIALSKQIFENNEDHKKLIDGAISIAKKIEKRKRFYDFKEDNLEEYRFIDLNILTDFIKDFDK